jgi:hypothetical protein
MTYQLIGDFGNQKKNSVLVTEIGKPADEGQAGYKTRLRNLTAWSCSSSDRWK